MDSHIRWLRRLMIPRLLTRLGIEYVVVADLLLVGLLYAGVDRLVAVTGALLLGQLVMVARVRLAMSTNPISSGYLQEYTNSRATVRPAPTPVEELAHPDAQSFFEMHNMASAGSIEVVTDDGTAWSHAFVSPDGFVLGSATAGSSRPMIVTMLNDSRFLVSTHQLVPPHESLVVNHVRRANARQLLESHVGVLEVLHRNGVSPVAADAEAIASILRIEHEAWSQIGPYLGPFLAVGTRLQPFVLHTRVAAETILQRGLDHRGPAARGGRPANAERDAAPTPHDAEEPAVPAVPDASAVPAVVAPVAVPVDTEPPTGDDQFPWQQAA